MIIDSNTKINYGDNNNFNKITGNNLKFDLEHSTLKENKRIVEDNNYVDMKVVYLTDNEYQYRKKLKKNEETNTKLMQLGKFKRKEEYMKKENYPDVENKKNSYIGEKASEFNKDSPFFKMLIKKRIQFCFMGSHCHIAAFVSDLENENKFSNWAFGKFAIGENSNKSRYGNKNIYIHAEIDALNKLYSLIRIQKCKKQKMDLLVIRVNKSGNLCESAPCYHCTQELAKAKVVSINKLYFSRWDGTITCIKFTEWSKNDNLHISKGWRYLSKYCSK